MNTLAKDRMIWCVWSVRSLFCLSLLLKCCSLQPAHAKSALLGSNVTIPIQSGKLALGTWQGIWLCEHRNHKSKNRSVHFETWRQISRRVRMSGVVIRFLWLMVLPHICLLHEIISLKSYALINNISKKLCSQSFRQRHLLRAMSKSY